MRDNTLINGELNRKEVWKPPKQGGFIVSIFHRIAPLDFLIRRVGDNTALGFVDEVYDGNNRLVAIRNFIDNMFPINIAATGIPRYFRDMPQTSKRMFRNSISLDFTVLENCTDVFACDMAAKRNEGTAMSAGEKISLWRRWSTERARLLDELAVGIFVDVSQDRARGLKSVALFIMNTERTTSINEHPGTWVDYHSKSMNDFFSSSTPLKHATHIRALVNDFREFAADLDEKGDIIPGWNPDTLKRAECSRFFAATESMLLASLVADIPVRIDTFDVARLEITRTGMKRGVEQGEVSRALIEYYAALEEEEEQVKVEEEEEEEEEEEDTSREQGLGLGLGLAAAGGASEEEECGVVLSVCCEAALKSTMVDL